MPEQTVARVILGEPRLTGIAPFDPNAGSSAGGLFETGLLAGPSSCHMKRAVTFVAALFFVAPAGRST
jgi:hypothetical protein